MVLPSFSILPSLCYSTFLPCPPHHHRFPSPMLQVVLSCVKISPAKSHRHAFNFTMSLLRSLLIKGSLRNVNCTRTRSRKLCCTVNDLFVALVVLPKVLFRQTSTNNINKQSNADSQTHYICQYCQPVLNKDDVPNTYLPTIGLHFSGQRVISHWYCYFKVTK